MAFNPAKCFKIIVLNGTLTKVRLEASPITGKPYYFSDDDGANWAAYQITGNFTTGQIIYVKGDSIPSSSGLEQSIQMEGSDDARIKISGSLASLLDEGAGEITEMVTMCYFSKLFKNNAFLFEIDNDVLPFTKLKQSCYNQMFYGCKNLEKVGEDLLPATQLDDGCYVEMFYDCPKLLNMPKLPATNLVSYCYCDMFCGDSSLTKVPKGYLSAKVIPGEEGEDCMTEMFKDCTSLKSIYVEFTSWGDKGHVDWLKNVSKDSSGKFQSSSFELPDIRDASHIPTEWVLARPKRVGNITFLTKYKTSIR